MPVEPPSPATNRGAALFLKRWALRPLQMGSITPSSAALCRRLVRHTQVGPDELVLELGAGTGVVSEALLRSGLPPARLVVVEIEAEMANRLRRRLPGAHVIEGDARQLPELLPEAMHRRFGTVICGIPLVLLARSEQKRFLDAIGHVAPGRGFLHYSYCVTSPLPSRAHGLAKRREAWTPLNLPPASVWRYRPAA